MEHLNEEFTQLENSDYAINELGQVKNLRTKVVLKQFLISDYPAVNISVNGKRKTVYVHHLLAEVFLNHKAKRGIMSINHIDQNKTNNRLDNLEIISHRRNTALCFIHRNREMPTGVTKTETGVKQYKAQINYRGVNTYLGCYHTPEEAHAVYVEASDSIIKTGGLPERFVNREKYKRFSK